MPASRTRTSTWPTWATPGAIGLALGSLVIYSFVLRWRVLSASPFPLGIDGYFYPVQLRALLEHGSLQYPAAPLGFVLMLPFALATDPIIGAKLAAAWWGALIALPAYGVGARLGKSRGAGLLAAALATTSAGSMYMTIEFVKNGIGLTVAMFAVWLGLRALDKRHGSDPGADRRKAPLIAAVLGAVAALATHKMAGVIAIIVLIPAALAAAAGRGALRGRRLLYAVALAGAAILALAILGIVLPHRFVSPADATLARGLWTTTARWDLPALATPTTTLAMGHEAALGAILAMLAACTLVRPLRRWIERVTSEPLARTTGETAASWVIVALALGIGLPWLAVADGQALGFRLRVAAFVPMALCAAIVARPLLALALVPLDRTLRASREPLLAITATLIALAIPPRTEGEVVTHPALVTASLALVGRVPAGDTVIVPERHIAFMVAWYARVDVAIQPDAIPREHRWRLMPLAFIGAESALDRLLIDARREPNLIAPIGLHPRHPNGLVLVAEPTWDWIFAHLPPSSQRHFAPWPAI